MRKLLLGTIVVLGWLGASMAHAITVTFNGTEYPVDSFTITHNAAGVVIETAGNGSGGEAPPPPPPPPSEEPLPPPPPPVDTGSCVTTDTQKCGSINWSSPGPRINSSVMGTSTTMSWQFTTTSNPLYSGDINISETTGNELVSRRMWISTQPGGASLSPDYRCSTEGSSTRKIGWAQQSNFMRCSLAPNTTYFLNVKNVSGCSAAQSCGFYRNIGTSGNP